MKLKLEVLVYVTCIIRNFNNYVIKCKFSTSFFVTYIGDEIKVWKYNSFTVVCVDIPERNLR